MVKGLAFWRPRSKVAKVVCFLESGRAWENCAMSKVLRVLDTMSGGVLLLMAVLTPWMLGATTLETIWALNGLGFLSGGLWIAQRIVRSRARVGRQTLGEDAFEGAVHGR